MCLSCGCGKPNDDHGDSRNITMDDFNQAAEAAGTTRDKVIQNIMNGLGVRGSASSSYSGQSQQSSNAPATASDPSAGSSQQQGQPGERVATPGQESGTAWGQSKEGGQTGQNERESSQGSQAMGST
jgi:hypothetical protein